MREMGVPYDEVKRLSLYEKRLLLGYVPARSNPANELPKTPEDQPKRGRPGK